MKTTTLSTPLPIVRLEVEQLFGKYSYTLPSEENAMMVYSPFILYGDNGTGKTTLLNILFHLLSPKLNRDHLAFITKTPFAKFSVCFADGKQLCVSRPDGALQGTFSLQLFQGTDTIAKVKAVDQNFSGSKQEKLDQFYQELFKVPFRVYFIRDNRTIEINSVDDDSQVPVLDFMRESGLFEDEGKLSIERVVIHKKRNANLERDQSLRKSIQSLEKWLKDQVVTASQLGAVDVNHLYLDITQRITQSNNGTQEGSLDDLRNQLITQLKDLETRSKEFSYFGLASPLDMQKFVAVLQTQTHDHVSSSITWQVLKPYMDGVAAQLKALENTKKLLSLFINKVNQLFRDKEIQLHVQNGLTMTTSHHQQKVTLSPEMLSSGEKQLLLLFCNTLTARDEPTLFIIDEPEISLNIKWTRQLIATLLDFIEGSSVQLLLASHSFELLSQYQHQVVELIP